MRYLVALDGFEQSERALAFARDQAEGTDATVDVAHVVDGDDPEGREQIRKTAAGVMEDASVDYELHFPETDKGAQPAKSVARRLLEFAAEHDHDAVYVGNEDTGTAERVIVGSVAATLVDDRSIPVVLVP